MKILKPPSTTFFPVPAVMVTTLGKEGKPNIITLAWAGVVNSEPPMIGIGVRPERHSFQLLQETGEFVVNLPTASQVKQVDLCGVFSGADTDKFQMTGFTPEPASKVKPPMIAQCPVNLECVIRHTLPLGSHHLFVGEVVAVKVDQDYLDRHNLVDIAKMQPLAYATPSYWGLSQPLGLYGFSKKDKQ